MYITVALLQKHKACDEQVDLFAATFPDGVQVTEAVCLAVADKFNFAWAADNLLPPEASAEYSAKHAPIRAEYAAQDAGTWAEYDVRFARYSAEYEAKRDGILAEYWAKLDGIWAEYGAKLNGIWSEYRNQRAALFGRIAATIEE